MSHHEYSVIGHSRAFIGRWLGVIAGALASGVALLTTWVVEFAAKMGWSTTTSKVIVIPLSAAVFYGLAHAIFDRWAWKWSWVRQLFGIPDLNGHWHCEGTTLDGEGNIPYRWEAEVTIHQTWEKISVFLKTAQSSSRSKSASLVHEPGHGFTLMYSYANDPRIGEPEIRSHVGYCELLLSEDLTRAEGDYFNNRGRVTFGRMILTRKETA